MKEQDMIRPGGSTVTDGPFTETVELPDVESV